MADKASRSILKSISWRATGTGDTILISWLITGKIDTAIAIGGIEVFTKMALYFFHERLWDKIKFGRIEENQGIDYNI